MGTFGCFRKREPYCFLKLSSLKSTYLVSYYKSTVPLQSFVNIYHPFWKCRHLPGKHRHKREHLHPREFYYWWHQSIAKLFQNTSRKDQSLLFESIPKLSLSSIPSVLIDYFKTKILSICTTFTSWIRCCCFSSPFEVIWVYSNFYLWRCPSFLCVFSLFRIQGYDISWYGLLCLYCNKQDIRIRIHLFISNLSLQVFLFLDLDLYFLRIYGCV